MWRMTILSELLFLHVRGEPVVVVDRDIVIGMQERCPDRNQIKSHRATEPPSHRHFHWKPGALQSKGVPPGCMVCTEVTAATKLKYATTKCNGLHNANSRINVRQSGFDA